VLSCVLDRFTCAEIHRGLDRVRGPADPTVDDAYGDRPTGGDGAQGIGGAEVAQYRRINASSEHSQLIDSQRRVSADFLEELGKISVRRQLLGDPKLDLDRHELLLGPIMQILLKSASLALHGIDDPRAGGAELRDKIGVLGKKRGYPVVKPCRTGGAVSCAHDRPM
jgi:hypothetical protein